MRLLPLLPLLPLLILPGACAASGTESESRDQAALARELADRTAGRAESCVPATQAQSLQGVDRRTIVYRSGRTVWVNRLDADCPGLDPTNILIVEANGSQYCRGDRVRSLEPHSTIPGPFCVLRDWVPYRAR
jgi:hypothetical protein